MSSNVVESKNQPPIIAPPRLPYHPAIEERFGIDKSSWKALVEAAFPLATSTDSVILALSYCKARSLDPFKRVVHIVPIWNKQLGKLVDTVWPGIGELRTTAFRTREYAGKSATEFGPDLTETLGGVVVTFPEWAQVTVKRLVCGQVVEFVGPRVYWKETYATAKKDSDAPNEMWRDRPRGQIDKCAEAAALRAAFPEEIGGELIHDEVSSYSRTRIVTEPADNSVAALTKRLTSAPVPAIEEKPAPADDVEEFREAEAARGDAREDA